MKPEMRSAISSDVIPARVWKRQLSRRSEPSNAPRCVWVLPTSTARSTPRSMGNRMPRVSRPTLYVIPGSHPAMAARRMLEQKGIDYKRRDLMPVVSRGVLKVMRFPGITIPSLRIDGRRITGSREISKALDEIKPDPPLFPADPAQRVQVEDAERWGDEILQNGGPAHPLERDQARPQAAPLVPRRGEDRCPPRYGRGDRRADHRGRDPDQRRDRRGRRGRPRRLPGMARPHRRLDRRRRPWRRPSQRSGLPDRVRRSAWR